MKKFLDVFIAVLVMPIVVALMIGIGEIGMGALGHLLTSAQK